MQLGSFEVPESRLIPNVISDARKIFEATRKEPISAKDMAKLLGYATHTTNAFYRRLKAMTSYGLLEGRGSFKITPLCEMLLFPESPDQDKKAKKDVVLHVGLWNEIYTKWKKSPPIDSFWVQLKNITGIDQPTAQKVQEQVRKWYMEDIAHVSDDVLDDGKQEETETQSLSLKEGNTRSMSQQLVSPDQEKLEFGGAVLLLPKKDLKKEWEKLQKYMRIYLEDYQEPSIGEQVTSDTKEEL